MGRPILQLCAKQGCNRTNSSSDGLFFGLDELFQKPPSHRIQAGALSPGCDQIFLCWLFQSSPPPSAVVGLFCGAQEGCTETHPPGMALPATTQWRMREAVITPVRTFLLYPRVDRICSFHHHRGLLTSALINRTCPTTEENCLVAILTAKRSSKRLTGLLDALH